MAEKIIFCKLETFSNCKDFVKFLMNLEENTDVVYVECEHIVKDNDFISERVLLEFHLNEVDSTAIYSEDRYNYNTFTKELKIYDAPNTIMGDAFVCTGLQFFFKEWF